MSKNWIILYSFNLRIHEEEDFLFYFTIVGFDSFFETVGAIFIYEVCDYRYRLIGFHFSRDIGTIHHNLRMEDLLFDTLVKVVGHSTHKHTLCEVADFRCRDKAVHLCGDRSGFVIAVDGHRLTLLKHLAEAFT